MGSRLDIKASDIVAHAQNCKTCGPTLAAALAHVRDNMADGGCADILPLASHAPKRLLPAEGDCDCEPTDWRCPHAR